MSLNYHMRIYHLVQPYFFAHQHFQFRKIQVLREAGFDAWVLVCVPERLYRAHELRYRAAIATGFIKVLRVLRNAWRNPLLALFLAKEAVLGQGVLVHVLRCDPGPVIWLRRIPRLGSRIRYVLEYEGDMPSELIYQSAFTENPRPPEDPPPELRLPYQRMIASQTAHVASADGLVLMSEEHIALWESRLGRRINACCLPTLADPQRIRFDATDRAVVRAQLGLENRFVLVYAGNVITKWQRLDAMCGFVAQLGKYISELSFLALVRLDDLGVANMAVARHGIGPRTTVLHVPAGDVTRYLSAADAAVFLRHQHSMNFVVTSGKLGEYLAAGLPVITTGANAQVLNELIRQLDAGVFVDDSLIVDDKLVAAIQSLRVRTASAPERLRIASGTIQRFSGSRDPFRGYATFIGQVMPHENANAA